MCAELPDTIQRASVQPVRAMGLGLKSDPHMFDGSAQDCVGDSSEGTRGIVLAVAEAWRMAVVDVALLELTPGVVETTELD